MGKTVHVYIRDEAEYEALRGIVLRTETSFSAWLGDQIHRWLERPRVEINQDIREMACD